DGAWATALSAWRCSVKLRDSRGPMVEYMLGVAGMGMQETVLRGLADQPEVTPPMLRAALDVLASVPPRQDAFADALKVETQLVARELGNHRAEAAVGYMEFPGPTRLLARSRILFPLVYKPNLSTALHADAVRARLGSLDWTVAQLDADPSGLGGCPHCTGMEGLEWW